MVSKPKSPARIEPLEARQLLSATVVGTPAVVNVSKMAGDQSEEAVAINPLNPQQVLIASNTIDTLGNAPVVPAGIFTALSNDGGATWTGKVIGLGADSLPKACCDPSLAWDNYGNLFLAYLRIDTGSAELLGSNDAGSTWHLVKDFAGSNDQPTVVAGHNSVWVTFQQDPQAGVKGAVKNQGAVAYGAAVTGPGRIGPFKAEGLTLPASNVADVAIGPAGQVTVAYQVHSDIGPSTIYTRTDPDGVGPKPFGPANTQVSSNLGFFYPVPPQAIRTTDAEAALAYDTSGGPFTGRLYLAYVDSPNTTSGDTDIFLRYSDDNGATWSAPTRVNDDTTTASQFFPRLSVDPVTGAVGLTWYDARNDTGVQGEGGTNNVVGDDVQVYGAVGTPSPNGVQFSPNFVVQPGFSNATALPVTNPTGAIDVNQFGDYNGQAFYNGVLRPAWADNSNSTDDNFGGLLRSLDVYTATINVQTTNPPTPGTLLGEFGDVGGKLKYTTPGGSRVVLNMRHGSGVAWRDPAGNLALRVVGSDARSALVISGRGVTLGNVTVIGDLGSFVAPQATLAGTFSVSGSPSKVMLGSISGGNFTSVGPVGKLTLGSLMNGRVLAGANLGSDNALGGGDDAFVAGSIDTLTVKGAVQNSFIGAGVNPVDGVLGNGDDQIIGATASQIRRLRAHSVDSASKIEAGAFGSVLIPGAVNPATDPRFKVG